MNLPLIKKLSQILFVLAIIVLGVFYFKGQNHLSAARQKIDNMQDKIKNVEDSLEHSQNQLGELLLKIRKAEWEIETLKTEREILEIEIQKDQAKNKAELQSYKKRIEALEAKRNELREQAKNFDL